MMKRKILIGIVVACASFVLLVLCAILYIEHNENAKDVLAEKNTQLMEDNTEINDSETDVEGETETVDVQKHKIRLMMVGDNLMHLSIVNSGYLPDGRRDYSFMFEPIKDYLGLADIKITNQEIIFGGNNLGFSGYPKFNSPTELGDSIVEAGFNVVLHGTNHAADKGIEGILNCIDFWEKYPEVVMTGIFRDVNEENQDIGILEVDGVTFAILNYTYSPNLSTLPKWLQGHLGMLCDWNTKTGKIDFKTIHPDVLTDIQKAKQMADVVVVCPHWGNEYTFVPTVYQKKFAKEMTEAGADLILGTHPHVIQPVEWIEADNGNKSLCYYSLGNYVSTQYKPATMLEAMAWVVFEVDDESVRIVEEESGAIPMVYQYKESHEFENIYFLDEYTKELSQKHGIIVHGEEGFSYDNLQKWADEVLGEWRLQYQEVFRDCIKPEMWR